MPKTKRRRTTATSRCRNPWDRAKRLEVVRGNFPCPPGPLEDGVKFFILMLEQLGCETLYSCEGHPAGFYVMFRGPLAVARAVARCGFFRVELDDEEDTYVMRLHGDWSYKAAKGEARGEEERVRCLRRAATAWVKAFGELGMGVISGVR
jgi:hypothetical protein